MGLKEKKMSVFWGLVVIMLVSQVQVSIAAVYKVGDSAGWTIIGNVDYKQWAASKTFHVGDIILFEYNSQFHNVMQVKHSEYQSCNASAPIITHTTGNDSITITSKGHHFYICGIPGHCQAGQKVDINVLRVSTSSKAPSPSTSSSSSISPSPSVAVAPPATSTSDAVSLLFNTCKFLTQICLALVVTIMLV